MLLGVTIALIGSLVVILAYAVTVYNALVRARQMVQEAWSGIDVQLKRRADLIPNLVATRFGFELADYFELENPDDRKLPNVKFS